MPPEEELELPLLEDEDPETALATTEETKALTMEEQLEAELDADMETAMALSNTYEASPGFTERGPDKAPVMKVVHAEGHFNFENPFDGMPTSTTRIFAVLTAANFYPSAAVPDDLTKLPEDLRELMEAVPKRADGSSHRFCSAAVPVDADPVRYPDGTNPHPGFSTFSMVGSRFAKSPDMIGTGYHNKDGVRVTKKCTDCPLSAQHDKKEAGYDAICKPRGYLELSIVAWTAGSKNTTVKAGVGIVDPAKQPIPNLVVLPVRLIMSTGMTRSYTEFVDKLSKEHKAAPNRCLVVITCVKKVEGSRTYGEVKFDLQGNIFDVGTKEKPGKDWESYRAMRRNILIAAKLVEAQMKANHESAGEETDDAAAIGIV